MKAGVLVHPTRLACCGNTAGPSLYHLLAILGKERALRGSTGRWRGWGEPGHGLHERHMVTCGSARALCNSCNAVTM